MTSIEDPKLDLLALMRPLVAQETETILAPLRTAVTELQAACDEVVARASLQAGNAALGAVIARAGGSAPEQAAIDRRAIDGAKDLLERLCRILRGEESVAPAQPLASVDSSNLATMDFDLGKGREADRKVMPSSQSSEGSFGEMRSEDLSADSVSVPRPPVDAATRRRVLAILDEANALFEMNDWDNHELRLLPLTQAIVAEIRALLRLVDGALESKSLTPQPARQDEDLSLSLHGVLRQFSVRKKRDLPRGYICGLSYADAIDKTIDWPAVAFRARERVRAFDQDAATELATPRDERASKSKPIVAAPVVAPVAAPVAPPPAWPALRAAAADGVVLVVGNAKSHREREVDARQRLRFGEGIEWVNIDNDKSAARQIDSVAARIVGNSIVAVVILEGFVNHRVTKKIEDACLRAAVQVPYAYGGKGGRREFEEALATLDRKLGNLAHFGTESVGADAIAADTSRAKLARVMP